VQTYRYKTHNFRLKKRVAAGLLLIMLASTLAACGETTPTVSVAATTLLPVTKNATTQANPTPTATAAPISAPATTASTTNLAPTTTVPTTAAPTSTPTVQATPTIGNSYPSGPAPTAAPPPGGLVEVTLQVPEQLRNGSFATTRKLKLPPGFSISVYAQLGATLRFATFSPDGRLFAAERGTGHVVVIKDNGATGTPQVFAEGLNGPHGLAFQAVQGQMYLYVAENNRVTRLAYQNGQEKAAQREVVVNDIPTGGNHTTRSIAFGPDGKMYISIGSSCNVCEEGDQRRAAVMQYNADGSGGRIFARGLRNEVGIMFHPQTGELWGVENSRDNLGNDNPPEEINILVDGGNYGWPYCVSNQVWDSNFGLKNAAYCQQTIPPALPMQAHSAPLGLDFYYPKTQMFPADYQGVAFVGFHGSWNRSPATGYKVVVVQVKDGRPVSYADFATGWLTGSSSYWGRPVDPVVAPDGSLFVTDDFTSAIYHITYKAGQ
jgi:glucose/arabinose dehydrogenase